MMNTAKYFTIALVISMSLVFLATTAMADCPARPEACKQLKIAELYLNGALAKFEDFGLRSRLIGKLCLIKAYIQVKKARANLILDELDGCFELPSRDDIMEEIRELPEEITVATLLSTTKVAIVHALYEANGITDRDTKNNIMHAFGLIDVVRDIVCD